MAASMSAYESWLTERLLSLNPDTDTDIFVSYITGILDEDSPEDEKKESIVELIGQVVEDNQEAVCDELFLKWDEINGASSKGKDNDNSEELTDHLTSILEKQKIEVVKAKEQTAEEKARKEAILAQYGHVSSGESDDDDDDPGGDAQDDLLAFKNTNAEAVKKNELELKEKSRLEAEKKREKDKQDREAQKQKQKDRKENEKKRTQKGEKRR